MNSKTIANGILRAVGILAAIVLIAIFLYKIQSVIAYLAFAFVIALLGRPIVSFLRRRLKFPNTLAVITTILAMLGLLIGVIALFVPLITEQGKNLSLLDIDQLSADVNEMYLEALEYFGANQDEIKGVIEEADIEKEIEKSVIEGLNLDFIPNLLNSFVNTLSNFSIGLFSVLFISFFFLKDSKLFKKGLMTFIPQQKEPETIASIDKISGLLSRYFAGLLLQLFILFIIYTATLLIVGVENAIVIAFLCALFNIIPYVGPLIGGSVMITLTMTSHLGADFSSVILPKIGYVLIGIVIGQLIDNFFSQPFIFSSSVRSHPLEIFLIIIIAGLLFGIVGMIVAVPGYTAIKVILKEFLSDNSYVKKFTKDL